MSGLNATIPLESFTFNLALFGSNSATHNRVKRYNGLGLDSSSNCSCQANTIDPFSFVPMVTTTTHAQNIQPDNIQINDCI